MNVSARLFRKVYEMIVQKLLTDFENHDVADYDSKSSKIWLRRFKENNSSDKEAFKIKYGNLYGKRISTVLFDMDAKGTYFYLANKITENNSGNVNITVKRLYLALLYLKYKDALTVEEITVFQGISESKMRVNLNNLLEEFERENFSKENQNIFANSKEDQIDTTKLDLSRLLKKLHPGIIEEAVHTFFDKIKKNKFYDAWLMISPWYQKKSGWGGSYDSFCRSFNRIESITPYVVGNWNFSRFAVNGSVMCSEVSAVCNVTRLFDDLNGDDDILALLAKDIVEAINSKLQSLRGKDLAEISDEELFNPDFQRVISSFVVIAPRWRYVIPPEEANFYTCEYESNFTFIPFENRWLIDKIEGIPFSFFS